MKFYAEYQVMKQLKMELYWLVQKTNKKNPLTHLPASESLHCPLGARSNLIIIT